VRFHLSAGQVAWFVVSFSGGRQRLDKSSEYARLISVGGFDSRPVLKARPAMLINWQRMEK